MQLQSKQATRFFSSILLGEVSHGQVRGWSHRIKKLMNTRSDDPKVRAQIEQACAENDMIDELIDKVRPHADPAFAASGRAVLRDLAMTSRGRARRTVIGGKFNEECREVLRSDNCQFMLETFETLYERHCYAVPAWWRCYAEGIGGFSYRLLSWQTCSDPYHRLEVAL